MPEFVFITPPPGRPDTPMTFFVADATHHPGNTPGAMLVKTPGETLDPACCCEAATVCCCPQFEIEATAPATLTLTVNAGSCPEIDGATVTLNRVGTGTCAGNYSSNSHAIGNCGSPVSVGWLLECGTLGNGDSCLDFRLTLTRSTLNCVINGAASRTTYVQSGCTCSPLVLTFTGFSIDDSGLAPGTCDCCPGGATFSVTITE